MCGREVHRFFKDLAACVIISFIKYSSLDARLKAGHDEAIQERSIARVL
jgi:hypothetical protein